ncbi:MAG TPA: amidohydrolase, partial [Gammaproteobacteria bacterium]
MSSRLSAVACLLLLLAGPARGAGPGLFDGHIHYSASAWESVPAERALELLRRAGIERALVSSTPVEGTLRLHALAPELIVPELRPYRSRDDMASWHRDPALVDYVAGLLAPGHPFVGLGEVHLQAGDVGSPELDRLLALALEHRLFVHAHTDVAGVEALLARAPRLGVLWAHAGFSARPPAIAALLERHPAVVAELSYRYDELLDDGRLEPAWRELLLRYPERFVLGSDTWVAERWDALA